jgi:hypothetical protein
VESVFLVRTGRLQVLHRTGAIIHKPSGVSVETPLLVPAFSSKCFGVASGRKSELTKILNATSEFLTGTYLVSAYDIYYGLIPKPLDVPMRPELIVVDSGGYEVSEDNDLSDPSPAVAAARAWNNEMHSEVLDSWPPEVPAVFVTYDHPNDRRPVESQIASARDQVRQHSDQLHCFLIKPEKGHHKTSDSAIKWIRATPEELRSFDIVGVTEKELGPSFMDRMVGIARLRRALDEGGVSAPIHVFGALDPVAICLYYLSGAEVFDGLTWLRYGYLDDKCVYLHNHAALMYELHIADYQVRMRALSSNYYYLDRLQERLKDFGNDGEFSHLPHPELLKGGCDRLKRRLAKGGRG